MKTFNKSNKFPYYIICLLDGEKLTKVYHDYKFYDFDDCVNNIKSKLNIKDEQIIILEYINRYKTKIKYLTNNNNEVII